MNLVEVRNKEATAAARLDLSDFEILDIIHDFVFRLFCFYLFLLHFGLLVLLPYLVKKPIVV